MSFDRKIRTLKEVPAAVNQHVVKLCVKLSHRRRCRRFSCDTMQNKGEEIIKSRGDDDDDHGGKIMEP